MPFIPTDLNIAQVKLFIEFGETNGTISEHFNCSIKCIRKWRARIENELAGGLKAEDRQKLRQPEYKLTDAQLILVVNHMLENPFQSIKSQIQRSSRRENFTPLNKKKDKFEVPETSKKCELRQQGLAQRLLYANQYVNWPIENWRRTIALDEKVFSSMKDGESKLFDTCLLILFKNFLTI